MGCAWSPQGNAIAPRAIVAQKRKPFIIEDERRNST
jgi:hypothetical protein